MEGADRKFLANHLLPWVAQHYSNVLFAGAAPYTYAYKRVFDRTNTRYTTIDNYPGASLWGSKLHVQTSVQEIGSRFERGSFDSVILNGVFGFGINAIPEMNRSLVAIAKVLRPGGILIIGWNRGLISDPMQLDQLGFFFEPHPGTPFSQRKEFQTFDNHTHVYDLLRRNGCGV